MTKAKGRPKPEDLGEAPESRMENFPRQAAHPDRRADAVGDDSTGELVEGIDDGSLRQRERGSTRDPARPGETRPVPDLRKRVSESNEPMPRRPQRRPESP